jgi:transaldolase
MNSIQQAQQLGQSVWLDYIHRGLMTSGELKQLALMGITGLTANPTIMEKAIIGSTDYDEELLSLARAGKSNEQIYETLAIEDIRYAADLLLPVYKRSHGVDGYPCLEITPLLAYDTEGTIKESRRLFATIARPNVMVKVPATPQGIPAIRQLISEGINVNVTLIFSLAAYEKVKEAYISGLEDMIGKGQNPKKVVSVASFFLSRIDTAVDAQLQEMIKKGFGDCRPLQGKAAIASAKVAYKNFKDTFYGARFATLRKRGVHVQRLLWASTGTKNPAYSDVMYIEPIIGPETVNTMPLPTIEVFLNHGKAEVTIERGLKEAEETLKLLPAAGVNLKTITDELLADGVQAFVDSFLKLMAGIETKKAKLVTT